MKVAGYSTTSLAFIAGLILLFTSGWFPQQHTVGWVLVIVAWGPLALFLLVLAVIALFAVGFNSRDSRRRRKAAAACIAARKARQL